MSHAIRRSAIGLALLAALGAGVGAVETHHTAPQPPAAMHQQSAPAHQAATVPSHSANPIPQGNGGDHDGDNNGGPSDGDGTI
jgi:hypothetical protein